MNWNTIDYHGIASFDQALVGKIASYLEQKEGQVCNRIANCFIPYCQNSLQEADLLASFVLTINALSNQSQFFHNKIPKEELKTLNQQCNQILWENLEAVQGVSLQLLGQLQTHDFTRWNENLIHSIQEIKSLILNHLEGYYWFVQTLDELINKENRATIFSFINLRKTRLDPALTPFIKSLKNTLKKNFSLFLERLKSYLALNQYIKVNEKKFKQFPVFSLMDESDRTSIQKIYELLKLLSENRQKKILPQKEITQALKRQFSIQQVFALLQFWQHSLFDQLYLRSRNLKKHKTEPYYNATTRAQAANVLDEILAECKFLKALLGTCRKFYLDTYPDPYVKSRLGFPEWIVGPEPLEIKRFKDAILENEKLEKLFCHLKESVLKGPSRRDHLDLAGLDQQACEIIHNMEHPFLPVASMHKKSLKLVKKIEEMNLLGSFCSSSIRYVGEALRKGMRADWQYHTLFDFFEFHQIVSIYQGIFQPVEDRSHLNRRLHFTKILNQLSLWVQEHSTQKHLSEIEEDLSDIKAGLQDFLGSIQNRLEKEMDLSQASAFKEQIKNQLLEYRYLFGKFFHLLHPFHAESKWIRNQFLFVDQYFESVEQLIYI